MASKQSDESNLPWIEKYRPKTLDNLIAHKEIIGTINKLIDAQKLPHLLFYGPPGTGKTSTILACARRLYGHNFQAMALELNASDDRGINVVRNQITNFAGTRKLFSSGVKLIILDEADALTNDAQFALRRVIEKYSRNTRFCLICNFVNKIIPALQSRCTKFRFAPLKKEQMSGRLREIAVAEKVTLTDDGLEAVLALCHGDMRKMLNILQSAHMAYPEVNGENVYLCTGDPTPQDIEQIGGFLMNESFKGALQQTQTLMRDKGYALTDVLTRVSQYVFTLELPPAVTMYIMRHLADIEHHLSTATSEKLQLAAMVGVFVVARERMQREMAK